MRRHLKLSTYLVHNDMFAVGYSAVSMVVEAGAKARGRSDHGRCSCEKARTYVQLALIPLRSSATVPSLVLLSLSLSPR